jgi:hypothetical protein
MRSEDPGSSDAFGRDVDVTGLDLTVASACAGAPDRISVGL